MVDIDANILYVEKDTTIIVESEAEVNVIISTENVPEQIAIDVDTSVEVIVIESDPTVEVISTEEDVTVIESIETGPQGPPGEDGTGTGEGVYLRLLDSTSEDNIIYVGEAEFDSEEGETVWRIYKADFTGVTVKTWAGGNPEFVNKWVDRLTLEYS
jgi:hypothetical protein